MDTTAAAPARQAMMATALKTGAASTASPQTRARRVPADRARPVATPRQVVQVAAEHVHGDVLDRPAGARGRARPLLLVERAEHLQQGAPVGVEQVEGGDRGGFAHAVVGVYSGEAPAQADERCCACGARAHSSAPQPGIGEPTLGLRAGRASARGDSVSSR
jgi:hypothetical protein